jgi:hypothetical protein
MNNLQYSLCGYKAIRDRLLSEHEDLDEETLADTLEGIEAELRRASPADVAASLDRYEAKAKALEARLTPLLTADQQAGLLAAVVSRQRGAIVFLLPGVAQTLRLSREQQSRIEAIVTADLTALRNARPLQYPGLIRRASQSRNRIEDLLTPAQQQAWQTLLRGEPASLDRPQRTASA